MPPFNAITFTVNDGQAGVFSGPSSKVQAILGCSTGGTVNQVVPTASLATLQSSFLSGPLMEASGLVVQAGGTVLAVRMATSTPGAINSAIALSGGVTGATNASPTVITVASTATIANGAVVTIAAVGGNSGANGTWVATVINATTFSIPVDTSLGSAYTSGGTVTPNGSVAAMAGTATPHFTGTPNDDLYPVVVAQNGFAVGTAGGSVLVSLDRGVTFGSPINVGTATTLALADASGIDSGLVLSLGTSTKTWVGGGIVNGKIVGDSVRCSTVGPQPNDSGISAALGALVAYLQGSGAVFPIVQVVGNMASGDIAALESSGTWNLDNLATGQFLFERAIVSVRDAHAPLAYGGPGETETAWLAAINLDLSSTTAKRVCATGGHYNMPSAFPTTFASVPKYRRPLSFALAARQVAIPTQTLASKVGRNNGGNLTQIVVNPTIDPSDGFIYHNEALNPALDYYMPGGTGRFTTARTWPRKPGIFIAHPLTLAAQGSDFSLLSRALVMDFACTIAFDVLSEYSAADFTTKTNGTLSDSAANTIRGDVSDAITSTMVGVQMLSGFSVAVDQTQNIQSTQTLKVTITILGVVYLLEIDVSMAFANQLAAAPVA